MEHTDERVEIALAGGRQVRIDDLPLTSGIGVRRRRLLADAAPSPARELPGGRRRTFE
jgi:hypothetical protein